MYVSLPVWWYYLQFWTHLVSLGPVRLEESTPAERSLGDSGVAKAHGSCCGCHNQPVFTTLQTPFAHFCTQKWPIEKIRKQLCPVRGQKVRRPPMDPLGKGVARRSWDIWDWFIDISDWYVTYFDICQNFAPCICFGSRWSKTASTWKTSVLCNC